MINNFEFQVFTLTYCILFSAFLINRIYWRKKDIEHMNDTFRSLLESAGK